MVKKQKVQFTVEPIDVDGDNIPDGDLVTKYVNGKAVSRKYVPLKKLKKIVDNAQEYATAMENNVNNRSKSTGKTPRTPGGTRIVYKNMPDVENTDKPVMVADQTGFGQYIKAGAGLQLGSMATEAVVNGIADLFSGGEE